jgi:hypothetical protein
MKSARNRDDGSRGSRILWPNPAANSRTRELLPRRGLVHPVDRGHLHPPEVAGHGFVGGDHELLDDAVRHVALGAHDGRDAALQIEQDLLLRQVEVDAPAAGPLGADQASSRAWASISHAGDVGSAAGSPPRAPSHGGVRQARIGDDGLGSRG